MHATSKYLHVFSPSYFPILYNYLMINIVILSNLFHGMWTNSCNTRVKFGRKYIDNTEQISFIANNRIHECVKSFVYTGVISYVL